MSRDWLRHSTVDRRTLRPLSMVHFSPCQQPCCPMHTLSYVQQTCNNGEEKKREKTHITTELQINKYMKWIMKYQCEKMDKHFREKYLTVGLLPNESCTTKLIFMTHPLYTLLDLHVPPSPLTPLLTHFCVSTEAGMSSPFSPLPLSPAGLLRSPANVVALERLSPRSQYHALVTPCCFLIGSL